MNDTSKPSSKSKAQQSSKSHRTSSSSSNSNPHHGGSSHNSHQRSSNSTSNAVPVVAVLNHLPSAQSVGKGSSKRRDVVEPVYVSPEPEDSNEDHCHVCGDGGELLCCDRCPLSFHLACLDPPLSQEEFELLPDEWFCVKCRGRGSEGLREGVKPSFLGALLQKLDLTNPYDYVLPGEFE